MDNLIDREKWDSRNCPVSVNMIMRKVGTQRKISLEHFKDTKAVWFRVHGRSKYTELTCLLLLLSCATFMFLRKYQQFIFNHIALYVNSDITRPGSPYLAITIWQYMNSTVVLFINCACIPCNVHVLLPVNYLICI